MTATARDAETIGLVFKALVQHRVATVPQLARHLGVPYGPPLLGVLGITDDPRSRWAEVETLIAGLQRVGAGLHERDTTWEEMSDAEREEWLRTAQADPGPAEGAAEGSF